jgi:chromosome segregation ATPase
MAAASIIQPDHTLEERIYDLQKRDSAVRVRQILEEATQLLGKGRHIEASALVDKAEAMSSSASVSESDRTDASAGCCDPNAAKMKKLAAKLVADIGNGLAKVLVGAIEDLEQHITGETRSLTSAFSQRLDKIQAAIEGLQPIAERLELVVQAGAAADAKYAQLAAATASLQQADSRHDAEIGALRSQFEGLAAFSRDRTNEICQRIEEQERLISTANSATSELTARIAASAERLERQASAIRALHQAHEERATALGQVADVLARMRPTAEIPQTIAAI